MSIYWCNFVDFWVTGKTKRLIFIDNLTSLQRTQKLSNFLLTVLTYSMCKEYPGFKIILIK